MIGVVRNPARVPALTRLGVELRRADLAERERLAVGFAGADAVVSNAALFTLRSASWARHEAANVVGTSNVFEALAEAGVHRVVHVSSVAAYGFGARGPLTENTPLLAEGARRHPFNVYALSKALSERLAWRLAEQHELSLTTVRPNTIFGAFDPNFTPVFRRLVSLPVSVMPAYTRLGFVYAGDVAEAIARTLEEPAAAGRAYNTAGEGQTAWELAQAWREAGGPTAGVLLPLPVPITVRHDSSRARCELGWQTRPLVEGWRDTFRREAAA